MGWVPLQTVLIEGPVDPVVRRPSSLWSNTLVLPGIDVIDHTKFDTEDKINALSKSISLRGRHLEGAVLYGGHLRKADFTGAHLERADFEEADLRQARFECGRVPLPTSPTRSNSSSSSPLPMDWWENFVAQRTDRCVDLTNAILAGAQLQGASLKGALLRNAILVAADLTSATLDNAQFQGSILDSARLQNLSTANFAGASLVKAKMRGASGTLLTNLTGASLDDAELGGAVLDGVSLNGASLNGAQLQGASLKSAQLNGVVLDNTQLQGAVLDGAFLQSASISFANLFGASLDNANFENAYLVLTQLQGASLSHSRFDHAQLLVLTYRSDPRSATFSGTHVQSVVGFDGLCASDPSLACEWSPEKYEAQKVAVEQHVPAGARTDEALARIAILDPNKQVAGETDMSGAWTNIENSSSASFGPDINDSVKLLIEIGCESPDGPFVIGGLLRTDATILLKEMPFSG